MTTEIRIEEETLNAAHSAEAQDWAAEETTGEIGRASCRERV